MTKLKLKNRILKAATSAALAHGQALPISDVATVLRLFNIKLVLTSKRNSKRRKK